MISLLKITCSSTSLKLTLKALKTVFTIIEVLAPIVLIVSLSMHFITLISNPEEKKTPKKLINSVLATVIIFFIPFLVNFILKLLGEEYAISSCWNNLKIMLSTFV
ncbi:MAG: hypothetical protein IJI60_02665 [Bacilli bacterium]|nr:hypothetical protein [Bacilli bacterium]